METFVPDFGEWVGEGSECVRCGCVGVEDGGRGDEVLGGIAVD